MKPFQNVPDNATETKVPQEPQQQLQSPARMCIGCRRFKPRGELIRITAVTDSNDIKVNQPPNRPPTLERRSEAGSGDQFEPQRQTKNPAINGRSAYICKSKQCITQVLKGTRLKMALEGRKGKNVQNRRTVKWPLEPQLIQEILSECTEP
jgi:predicted RNA-binding protein YlxR (DUF448 family)